MPDLLTVSQIAERFGEPPQRVGYIIRKFRLKPQHRIGIIRLFSESQVNAIKQGLYGIHIHADKAISSNHTNLFPGKESVSC